MSARLLRDPLVHFLIAGAALFSLLSWAGEDADPSSRSIAVTPEVQAGLALRFEAVMRRAPTDAELDGLIQNWVREEVLYREALRLGLDGDDAVVRKRLASKMDQLASAQAEIEAPSDLVLAEWRRSHPERFAEGTSFTFRQAYFAKEDAMQAALEGAEPISGQATALPGRMVGADMRAITERFGSAFADRIAGLGLGGPAQVESGLGFHLVTIEAIEEGRLPPLEDIRERVESDWRSSTIAARRKAAFDVLREAYTVEIE